MDFQCDKCSKSFKLKRYLVKHAARIHSKPAQRTEAIHDFKCSDCDKISCCCCCLPHCLLKSFSRISHLQRHQIIHLNVREFKCPFCSKEFTQRSHLVRHAGRFHPQEKTIDLKKGLSSCTWGLGVRGNRTKKVEEDSPADNCCSLAKYFLCYRCGKLFDCKHYLTVHITEVHKPLVCHHCNDIFYGSTALKQHELRSRKALYVCSCGASFNSSTVYQQHRHACLGKGRFLCVPCGQIFVQRTQLDRHWKKVHFENPLCHICGWKADYPASLTRHFLTVHHLSICGFCGLPDPEPNHIPTTHWNRMRKPKALSSSKPTKPPVVDDRQVEDSLFLLAQLSHPSVTPTKIPEVVVPQQQQQQQKPFLQHDDSLDSEISLEGDMDEAELSETSEASLVSAPSQVESERVEEIEPITEGEEEDDDEEDSLEQQQQDSEELEQSTSTSSSESSNSTSIDDEASTSSDAPPEKRRREQSPEVAEEDSVTEKEIQINIIFEHSGEENRISLGERLPEELKQAFPELKNSVALLVDTCGPGKSLVSLNIPIVPSTSTDYSKWVNKPIYL